MTITRGLVISAVATLALALTACAPDLRANPGLQTEAAKSPVNQQPLESQSSTSVTPSETDVSSSELTSATPSTADPLSTQPVSASVEPTESTSATPEPSIQTSPTPESPAALLKLGDKSEQVRELQHRLLQLDWFQGSIDGDFGAKTQQSVSGFQGKRDMPVLGYVDQATWDKLVEMTRQPTREQMYNILQPGPALLASGDKGKAVKDIQARLKQIGWYLGSIDGLYSAKTIQSVKGFQQKRQIPVTGEVDQRTKDRLYAMTRTPTTDELNNVAAKSEKATTTMRLDQRCLVGRVICISKKQRRLAWVIDGKIQMVMDTRFGATETPTSNGVFAVGWKAKDYVSKKYKSPMPYSLFYNGGEAVHYSPGFAAMGYNGASHGCVNLRDKAGSASLFEQARVGDKVVIYA